MLELLIPLPNLYAAYTLSQNNAYKTNLIYSLGYIPFILYNIHIKANLEGFIIAGHGMYQAVLEEGYTHIPVEFCALDSQLSKAYLIADNETARRAVTEQDKLNGLLDGVLGINILIL
jgi:hypothetical protein